MSLTVAYGVEDTATGRDRGASRPLEFNTEGDIRSTTYEMWMYDSTERFTRAAVIRFAG